MSRLTRKRLSWLGCLLAGSVGWGPYLAVKHHERYGGHPWKADRADIASNYFTNRKREGE